MSNLVYLFTLYYGLLLYKGASKTNKQTNK